MDEIHHYEEKNVMVETAGLQHYNKAKRIYSCLFDHKTYRILKREKMVKEKTRGRQSAWNWSTKLCSNQEHRKCMFGMPFQNDRILCFHIRNTSDYRLTAEAVNESNFTSIETSIHRVQLLHY